MSLFDNNNERKQLQTEMQRQKRSPPGQSLTLKWPVLHEGFLPSFDQLAGSSKLRVWQNRSS